MMKHSVPSLGAINKVTKKYVSPTSANKKDKYVCPDCDKDLMLCQGEIKAHHFRHFSNKTTTACHYYDSPGESQIHKDAKLLMKMLLLTRGAKNGICLTRKCATCSTVNPTVDPIVEEFDIPLTNPKTSKIVLEHRFEYDGRPKIADVAYLDKNELVSIFEICNKHKTRCEDRPEPWFEIDARTLIEVANKKGWNGEIPCIRCEKCEDCKLEDLADIDLDKYVRIKLGNEYGLNVTKDWHDYPNNNLHFLHFNENPKSDMNKRSIQLFKSQFGPKIEVVIRARKGYIFAYIVTASDYAKYNYWDALCGDDWIGDNYPTLQILAEYDQDCNFDGIGFIVEILTEIKTTDFDALILHANRQNAEDKIVSWLNELIQSPKMQNIYISENISVSVDYFDENDSSCISVSCTNNERFNIYLVDYYVEPHAIYNLNINKLRFNINWILLQQDPPDQLKQIIYELKLIIHELKQEFEKQQIEINQKIEIDKMRQLIINENIKKTKEMQAMSNEDTRSIQRLQKQRLEEMQAHEAELKFQEERQKQLYKLEYENLIKKNLIQTHQENEKKRIIELEIKKQQDYIEKEKKQQQDKLEQEQQKQLKKLNEYKANDIYRPTLIQLGNAYMQSTNTKNACQDCSVKLEIELTEDKYMTGLMDISINAGHIACANCAYDHGYTLNSLHWNKLGKNLKMLSEMACKHFTDKVFQVEIKGSRGYSFEKEFRACKCSEDGVVFSNPEEPENEMIEIVLNNKYKPWLPKSRANVIPETWFNVSQEDFAKAIGNTTIKNTSILKLNCNRSRS